METERGHRFVFVQFLFSFFKFDFISNFDFVQFENLFFSQTEQNQNMKQNQILKTKMNNKS